MKKKLHKKIISITILLGISIVSYFYGLYSHKFQLSPFPQLLMIKNHIYPEGAVFSDISQRMLVPCTSIKHHGLMVALVFGQSNGANHGETIYKPEKKVYNYFKGNCYEAEDPLLGASGDSGSVWSRLGDMIIKSGLKKRVLLVPAGIGSTSIENWAPGGYLNNYLRKIIKDVHSSGFLITHIFFHQGESNKKVLGTIEDKKKYKEYFYSMLKSIRAEGVDAPIYVAIATYSSEGISTSIREAQKELPDPQKNIFQGPDTDKLTAPRYRWEVVHMSHHGLQINAQLWLRALQKNKQ